MNAFFETYFKRLDPEWDTTRQFTLTLNWKASVLPNIDPRGDLNQQVLFIVTGDRVLFPGGLWIPVSTADPASYKFLGQFSAEAPFKMSARHFQVGILGKTGKLSFRKPDGDIAARLRQVIV